MTILDKNGVPFAALPVKSYSNNGSITLDMIGDRSYLSSNEKALKLETVYTCVRVKAEALGCLPLKMYRELSDGTTELVKGGRYHRIFTQKPNDYQTLQEMLEMMSASIDLNGAFYAYKDKNDLENLMGIIPFRHQRNVRPEMDLNGNVYYTYTTNDGKPKMAMSADDLVIIKMFTLDGYTSVSPIQYNAQLLGISNAQEESYKELQENGITSQMALATENVFNNKEAIERIREGWEGHQGPKGVRKIPVLENGLKPVSLKLSPSDGDLINHRTFSVNRICRVFNVPPEKAGIQESKSKADRDSVNEDFMAGSINPTLVKWEYAINILLAGTKLKVKFDRKAFYAGNPYKMVAAVEREVKGGLASINEGRMDLGRDSVKGGDVFAVDNNNVVYGTWDNLEAIKEQLYGEKKPDKKPKEGDE